jgi:membrane-associated protein
MDFFGIDLIELIRTVGYAGVWGIIFAETGLFLGFFLPGDSLLFVAGFLSAGGYFSLTLMLLGITIAAILGNFVGYEFGRFVGPRLFQKEDSLIFKKAHLLKAQRYYELHGPKTIFLARFMPIVRTFAPIVAGIAQMDIKVFWFYNVVSGVVWAFALVFLGYYLGNVIDVDRYLLPIIFIIIFLSFLPAMLEFIKEKREK